jgi:hypothetical protein
LSFAGAQAYRQRLGIAGGPRMGIVVQRLVPAHCAGVIFTRNPITGADERVIEAAWGLGEAVVAGLVTPDRYHIARTVRSSNRPDCCSCRVFPSSCSRRMRCRRSSSSVRASASPHRPHRRRHSALGVVLADVGAAPVAALQAHQRAIWLHCGVAALAAIGAAYTGARASAAVLTPHGRVSTVTS